MVVQRVDQPKITVHHFWEKNESKLGLICTLSEFYPNVISVEWLLDGESQNYSPVQRKLQKADDEQTYSLSNQVELDQEAWIEGSEFTCQATHNNQKHSSVTSLCSACPTSIPSIYLETPSLRTVMTQGEVNVLCVVNTAYNANISWIFNGKGKSQTLKENSTNQEIIGTLTLSSDEWKNLANITCRVEHRCFPAKEKTSHLKGTTLVNPSVVIRRSLPDILTWDSALLECVITNISSCDLYVTFHANGVKISEEQYVDLPASKDLYSTTRLFSVPESHWQKDKTFTCKVNQGFSNSWPSNSTGKIFDDPSIELYLEPRNVGSNTQKLVCSGSGFNPQIKWRYESKHKPAPANDIRIGHDGRVAVTSYLTIPQQEWNEGTRFTCEVSVHKPQKTINKTIDICAVTPTSSQKVGIYLLGPTLQELKTGGLVPVKCILLGPNLREFSLRWKVGGDVFSEKRVTQDPIDHPNGTQSVRIVFNVSADTWNAHTPVSCEVRHRCSNQAQKENIKKCPDPKPPVLKLLRPSDSDLLGSENVTLLCLVSGFFPSDVIVNWKQDNSDLPASRYSSSPPVQYTGSSTYYMNSRLIVPKSEWHQNSTYSCVVGHESSDRPISSSIDHVFGKCTKKCHVFDSVIPSMPTASLLQGPSELVCLVFGFSPSAINITWFQDDSIELLEYNTSAPYWSPEGKYTVWSYLSLTNLDWKMGSDYTCRVTHSTKNLTVKTIKPEDNFDGGEIFDENRHDPIQADTAEENWKMASVFIVLFLISLLYSVTVTLAKARK
ncbi:hypothetical protein DPEC_G00306940 [Dallia pectoralis]|uniref:Uncharacterized protein n=1 Tax=Dallia pectoralis TaxID=75939 RepID=A0ACC2FE88_DALPE|nr:hypothetical protein DPEC_G00306940 [Dallia pectoralis]